MLTPDPLLTRSTFLGVVRHILTFAGGWLAYEGYLADDEVQAAVAGLVTVAGVIWSAVDKWIRK